MAVSLLSNFLSPLIRIGTSDGLRCRQRRLPAASMLGVVVLLLAAGCQRQQGEGIVASVSGANFEEKVLQSDLLVMVDFGATWCGPCRHMEPTVQAISSAYAGRARVETVDVDESSDLASEYNIQGVPTFVFFRDGEVDSLRREIMEYEMQAVQSQARRQPGKAAEREDQIRDLSNQLELLMQNRSENNDFSLEGAGPIAKNIGEERTKAIREQLGLSAGDAVFFICGSPQKFAPFAGAARTKVGVDLKLLDEDQFALCWIVDFPMFEWDEENKKVDFSHNPFSMPQGGLEALENQDPLTINAYQYDIVCNGFELSSGAIRNHRPEIMRKAFEIAGYDMAVLEEKFGGMLRAMEYGAPPHGGIAPGIDRIVMLLCGEENLREVTAFPMNQQAEDLLMGAPSTVSAQQMRELHIRANLPKS